MAATEGSGHPNVIAARSVADNSPNDVNVDPTSGALYIAIWTWNSTSGAWEKIDNLNDKIDTIITHLATIASNTAP